MARKSFAHIIQSTPKLYKVFLLSFLCLYQQKFLKAQQFNNWIFPEFNGLTFNTNPISFFAEGQITSLAGFSTASISDSDGNLLFYSDGVRVWNKNN
jgi:hypothetical protein